MRAAGAQSFSALASRRLNAVTSRSNASVYGTYGLLDLNVVFANYIRAAAEELNSFIRLGYQNRDCRLRHREDDTT